MNFTKFRVRNYKSIIDSGECLLASDMSILVGKNESGKTALLESLRDFDRDIGTMDEDVYPLDGRLDEPSVEVRFDVTQENIDRIQQDAEIKLPEEGTRYILENGLALAKNGKGQYAFADAALRQILAGVKGAEPPPEPPYIGKIRSAQSRVQELMQGHFVPSLDLAANKDDMQKAAREVFKTVKAALPFISDENIQREVVENLRVIIGESEGIGTAAQGQKIDFLQSTVRHLPRFIFFKEFSDTLPFEINIADVKQNQAVCDFAKIAGLDLDHVIATTDLQKRINLLNRHSASISGDFREYWGQNRIELVVKPLGDKLIFGIKDCETTNFYKVTQRSKGFRWFLSFYLRLNARAGENNVIVIDEPGMNLHAKAQKEIVQVLVDKIAPSDRVIFSTHSPYFIDPQRLDRVRLVLKSAAAGTVIREASHADADEESLLPLTTATGGEKARPVTLNNSKNVILSSAASFYFLKALDAFMGDLHLKEINLIPASDQNHVLQLVSLMLGQNDEFVVVLEQTAEDNRLAQALRDKLAVSQEKIVTISSETGVLIEDLFTRDDFHRFVLNAVEQPTHPLANSQYIEQRQLNKVFLARTFFVRIDKERREVALSADTISSFKDVFRKISVGLNGQPAEEKQAVDEEADDPGLQPEPDIQEKRRSFFSYLKK